MFESEKPAGKHGFLQVSGRDFQFRDGTGVTFWGTNFNGDGSEGPAVQPDKEALDVRSDTGELYRNFTDNYGFVNTEMTKCAFSFLEKNGEVRFLNPCTT